jgi:hypothetical protein
MTGTDRVLKNACDDGCQRTGVTSAEQQACIAISDQLAVSANIGGDHEAALCHGLERLERSDQLCDAI